MRSQPLLPPMSRSGWRTLVALTVLLIAAVGDASAQAGDDAFLNGLEALEGRRYVEAVGPLLLARSLDDRESMRKLGRRLWIGGTPYLPLYYLGVAYATLGNCRDAVVVFEQSERQGVILTDRERYADLQSRKQACITLGIIPEVEYLQRAATVLRQVEDAQRLANDVGELSHLVPHAWNPSLAQEYAGATADVTLASGALATARASHLASDFAQAVVLADRAVASLAPMKVELSRSQASLEKNARALAEAAVVLDDTASISASIDVVLADVSPLPMDLAKAREAVRDRAASLRDRLEQASAADAEDLTLVLAEARAVREQSRQLHADARAVVIAQLASQFDAAVADTVQMANDLEASLGAFETQLASAGDVPSAVRARVGPDVARLHRELGQLRRSLDRARDGRAIAEIRRLRGQLSAAHGVLRALSQQLVRAEQAAALTPPPFLVAAAKHFWSGAYAAAIDAAPESAIEGAGDRRWRVQAHLFRAASLFALSALQSPPDPSLRVRAGREVTRIRALDATFEPDAQAFSPQFRVFYAEARSN